MRDPAGDPSLWQPRYAAAAASLQQLEAQSLDYLRQLGELGTLARTLRDYPAAIGHFKAAVALAQELAQPSFEAANRVRLGVVQHHHGDWPAAEALFKQVLESAEAQAYHDFAWQHLGKLRVEQRRFAEARACFEAAMRLRQLKQDSELIASTQQALVRLAELERE